MSSNDDDGGPGRREVAHRLFAAEFDDADFSYSESDEERAPNYVITPSGARVNRLFLVGVLTETEWVNDDMLRARIVDPTGAFVSYAGQYQPDALGFLERAEPPAFLAVTGKARTFEPEDGDRVFTSVRPESISEVDADTRDRWVVEAAKRTVDRVETMATAMETDLAGDELVAALEADGVDPTLASGIALALDHYGTTPAYLEALRELAQDALETVAGERDEVRPLDVAPDEGGGDASALAGGSISSRPETDDGETAVAEPDTGEEASADAELTDASAETTTGSTSAGADAAESTDDPPVEIDDSPTTAEQDTASAEASDVTAETTPDAEAGTDDELGDFEPDEELEDFDPEEDEALTDEERREVEAEFDTEFSTGNEVEAEPELEPDTDPEAEPEPEPEPDVSDEPTASDADDGEAEAEPADEDAEPADDVSLDDAVMEAMEALDDGDGTDRDELVATVTDQTGADADAVEDAIEDALMSGRCYEPEDGLLKPI